MTRKAHIFVIIVMLGFFLIPSTAFACGTETKKSCCKEEIAAKAEKNDCCKNKQSKNQDEDCGGKCGNSNCTTSITQFNLVGFTELEFNTNFFDFENKNQKFYYNETNISSGFYFVWLPPKIN